MFFSSMAGQRDKKARSLSGSALRSVSRGGKPGLHIEIHGALVIKGAEADPKPTLEQQAQRQLHEARQVGLPLRAGDATEEGCVLAIRPG